MRCRSPRIAQHRIGRVERVKSFIGGWCRRSRLPLRGVVTLPLLVHAEEARDADRPEGRRQRR